MKVYLVRHALAVDQFVFKGDDERRPLTEKGKTQAQGLVALLDNIKFRSLLSSPALRCIETLEPLAKYKGAKIDIQPLLGLSAQPDDTLGYLVTLKHNVVACSHGENILGILEFLFSQKVAGVDKVRARKGSVWLLEIENHTVISATYISPPY
ncbi:MAG: histidine phosphatase family protein [Actinobacteria bacterium]|nr:histidine phosphatase family protein [Actinomycetota bacterium]MCL6104562.1 histidine phosphatase family protein [Actinomycetota bacterium]